MKEEEDTPTNLSTYNIHSSIFKINLLTFFIFHFFTFPYYEWIIAEADRLLADTNAARKSNTDVKSDMETIHTGMKDVDLCLSVMTMRYQGIYNVNLDTDHARQILAPSYYFEMSGEDVKFSDVLKQYIYDNIKTEYHRSLFSFIQYDVIKRQLKSGHMPRITYTKIDGETVTLSIYPAEETTLWVFERE